MPLRWDRETLYDVHFVSHPPDRTLFAGIYQLPPASYSLTDWEQVRIIPYWDWDFPTADETQPHGDGREWAARLERSLEEAVRLRLRADVPVACYLSGGIDSCAVLGFASRLSARPLRAYTLSFDHADYDESELARDQAQRSGAEFCRIDVGSEHLADLFSDAIYHAERPFANAHAIAKYLLSRAVRDSGIKVVLTGEGSDEIFAGYPHFRRDLVLYGGNGNGHDPAEAARLLAELEAANRVSAGTLMPQGTTALDSVQRVLGFVPSNLEAWAQIGAGLLRVASDSFRRAFSFLDHYVVEEAARMPVSMKIKGMTEKYVLREAARAVVTDAVYARQKHPFMSPPATIQQDGRLYSFLQDTLRSAALDGPGIYDRAKVTPLLDAIPSMDGPARARADALIMWMTSLCLLSERLGV